MPLYWRNSCDFQKILSLFFHSEKRPQTAPFDHQGPPNDFSLQRKWPFSEENMATLTGFETEDVHYSFSPRLSGLSAQYF